MATEEPVVVTEVVAPAIEAAVTVVVEKEPSVEAAEGKPKRGRKASAKGKPRNPSLHPPYFEMIKDAILTLKEKSGSSQYAIAKFVEEKQKNLPGKFKKVLLIQLKRLVAEGKLVKVKGSYKLPADKVPAAAAPAKKTPAAKPKATVKAKSVAKKAPAKKKPAAKPKAAPKAKTVAKPKAAAKPKPVAKAKPAAPKAAAKPAAKAKAKAKAPTKPAKVARTSTRSTPGGKATAAPKPAKIARTSTRSTPGKKSAAVPKPAPKKVAAKSVKPKAATPKKAAATRKAKK